MDANKPEFTEDLIRAVENSDSLDMLEITALVIIGRLARARWLNRSELLDDGLVALYHNILDELRDLLPHLDIVEFEQIHDKLVRQLRGGSPE